MEINDLIQKDGVVYRLLTLEPKVLVINCEKRMMPCEISASELVAYEVVETSPLPDYPSLEELTPKQRKMALERYAMIVGILPVLTEKDNRSDMIVRMAEQFHASKQTIRKYLCIYLVAQNMTALLPHAKTRKKELTQGQKDIRWSLNRFFYTRNCNSLKTAYAMMLKEKYCDESGCLVPSYPTFSQFRYFYRKTKNQEHYYISRNGIKDYQMNHRPLLGNGVQEFAPVIGTAMLDATTCDIFLVDEYSRLVSRPILVAAVDANTSLCIGYAIGFEGGIYSVKNLMLNILEDKIALCKRFGIDIAPEQWPNQSVLPGTIITDQGTEYKGTNLEQIAELGLTVVNLPSYRAELKGPVEKFFDLLQNSYKTVLKNHGVIMPDYQKRGAHDYRKDACLTIADFERIVVRTIVFYNSERLIPNYPFSPQMLNDGIRPYACDIQ